MKRKDLISLFEKNGWYLKRNGGAAITMFTPTEKIPKQFHDTKKSRKI